MVMVQDEIREVTPDALAMRIFLKALELAGGPQKLIEYRNLTWIPSLLQAAYAIVMSNEFNKTAEEIAETLGVSTQTIRNILHASPEKVKEKLAAELDSREVKVHTAAGLAQWAYQEIQAGNESVHFLESTFQQVSDLLDIAWPLEVLVRLRGKKFPISRQELSDLLKGIQVEGKPVEELINQLPETVNSPAQLLKSLKQSAENL
jgi:probable regulatory domain-containing protein